MRFQSVKNQSGSLRFNPNESEPSFQSKSILARIYLNQIINADESKVGMIQIKNSVWFNPRLNWKFDSDSFGLNGTKCWFRMTGNGKDWFGSIFWNVADSREIKSNPIFTPEYLNKFFKLEFNHGESELFRNPFLNHLESFWTSPKNISFDEKGLKINSTQSDSIWAINPNESESNQIIPTSDSLGLIRIRNSL